MDDAFGVGRVQSIGNLDSQIEQRLGFQRLASDHVFQGLAIEELHGDERLAFPLTDFIDRADVRMTQSRGGLRFVLETGERLRITGEFLRKKFQGHKTVEANVLGLIDHTHPTTSELLDDAVVRDSLADKLGGSCHWREC